MENVITTRRRRRTTSTWRPVFNINLLLTVNCCQQKASFKVLCRDFHNIATTKTAEYATSKSPCPTKLQTKYTKHQTKNCSPENILSRVATADIAITTVFDQSSHQAGTNDVNQIRLEIKLSKPSTKPQHVSDLQIQISQTVTKAQHASNVRNISILSTKLFTIKCMTTKMTQNNPTGTLWHDIIH